ncbi:MAG: acyl-CoA thioesterase [Candidatus Gastranaerophilaceae bacterium]|nr:acyl-CoA thioesterase [Candidatus Gastranaerophilaceae bacterium]
MSLFKSTYEVKVPFEDLDPMDIVWHGNYMRYMEQARCDLLNKIKYTYTNMKAERIAYPVVKMKVKYIKPAKFEDILTVETELISIEPSLDINYKIYNKQTGDKIFEGTTMQIRIDIETQKSIYTAPEKFIQAVKEVLNEKV